MVGRVSIIRALLRAGTPLNVAHGPRTWFHSRQYLSKATQQYATIAAADLKFGQPVFETHPHLLQPGELTPGITAQEYADRRSRLAGRLGRDSIAIVKSADLQYRSGAVFHEFHQNSDFFYLTGFNESDAVAVIETGDSAEDYRFHLYLRSKDEDAERWSGPRSGQQAALDIFNADETGDISKLDQLLRPLKDKAMSIYSNANDDSSSKMRPISTVMNELRIVKSEAEIANMRFAGRASGRAFSAAMRNAWTKEKDLWAYLEYTFLNNGCEKSAYVPVVAGGAHGACVHYVQNNDTIMDDELVLVDAGGQYGGYITDITRTWPVSGKFSTAQRDLYETILKVQRSSVSLCRQNTNLTLDKLHSITEDGLKDGLRQLGFDMSRNSINILFPHHVSHYIGLDVHDCPGYPRSTPLRAGHCVTVEPGIYVPDDERWPKHFRGMAIRIEDSVCVQEDGPLLLTAEAPKEVVDIEALRT